MRPHRRLFVLVFAIATAAYAIAPAAQSPGESQAVDPRVDDILTRLEARRDTLKDLSAGIKFVNEDNINFTKTTKIGRFAVLLGQGNPRCKVAFEKSEMDGILGKREWYIFDGAWWLEGSERNAQVTKRQVVEEGTDYDPFDLDETPFPIPIGQKKEKILRNFEVTLVPPRIGEPEGLIHLLCVPKKGSRFHRKYDSLDIYVHPKLDLPVRIITKRNDGMDVTTAELTGLTEKSINQGLSKSDFAPPKEFKDYKEVVEPLAPSKAPK